MVEKDAYTDDSALNTFLNGSYKNTLTEVRSQIDGKAETWRQESDPATAWTTTAEKQSTKEIYGIIPKHRNLISITVQDGKR